MSRRIAQRYNLHRRLELLEADAPQDDPLWCPYPRQLWGAGHLLLRAFQRFRASCSPDIRDRVVIGQVYWRSDFWEGLAADERECCAADCRAFLSGIWERSLLSDYFISCGMLGSGLWPREVQRECLLCVGRTLTNERLDEAQLIDVALRSFHRELLRGANDPLREWRSAEDRAWLEANFPGVLPRAGATKNQRERTDYERHDSPDHGQR